MRVFNPINISMLRLFLLGLSCLLFGLTSYSTYLFSEARGEITRARQVDRAAVGLLITLIDSETATRGFVLSEGDPMFLGPYTSGMSALPLKLKALKAAAEGTNQQYIARELTHLIDRETNYLARMVTSKVADKTTLDQGRETMDDIRERIDVTQQWSIDHTMSNAADGTFWARCSFGGLVATLAACFAAMIIGRRRD